jgi:hypothetical protein
MTKNYSVRLSDPAVNAAVEHHAATQGIPESTAIGRMLAEGLAAKEGKPIERFAALDPAAASYYSTALGELRALTDSLRGCKKALSRPRPLRGDGQQEWDRMQRLVAANLELVPQKIEQLKKAGHLELLLNNVDPKEMRNLQRQGREKGIKSLYVLMTALLGESETPTDVAVQ